MSGICLGWFFTNYHGKSQSNHRLGEYVWNFLQTPNNQIQVVKRRVLMNLFRFKQKEYKKSAQKFAQIWGKEGKEKQ